MSLPQIIPLWDLLALLWFIVAWTSYVMYTKRCSLVRKVGLLAAMNQVRENWAEALLKREVRIVDSQVINGLMHKETFFASTTLLILASTVALLGLGDKANQLFQEIPFAEPMSLALWELKVSVLAFIFVYAFFKFTWAIRQHSYCSMLLAAIPEPERVTKEKGIKEAGQLARLSNLAARHFNDGMRAYYFALAGLTWFYHPLIFVLSTIFVILVLYRREFHSRALKILS